MDIYRKSITGKAAEFANKKYNSHRQVPYTKLIIKLNCYYCYFWHFVIPYLSVNT